MFQVLAIHLRFLKKKMKMHKLSKKRQRKFGIIINSWQNQYDQPKKKKQA